MKRITLIVFYLLNILIASAQQQYEITGSVTDENNISVQAGNVILTLEKGAQLMKYALITEGSFILNSIPSGSYIFTIESLGYETFSQTIDLQKDVILNIILKEEITNLDEVVVNAPTETIIQKNGNLKINIENSIFKSFPKTLDILSKLPKIQVSPDRESISIIGEGSPLIYLDNQKITVNELNSIPIDAIKEIEIINNPSAKYEASGNTVILIKRKKNYADGLKTSLSEIASLKRSFSNYISVNSSLKRNKLELKANLGYNQLSLWESNASNFNLIEEDITTNYNVVATWPRLQVKAGVGAFYQFNEDDYISINTNLTILRDKTSIITKTYLREQTTQTNILSSSDNKGIRDFFTSNLNFNKKLKPIDGNLFFGIQYSTHKRDLKSNVFNNINDTYFEFSQKRDQKNRIHSIASRIDFEKFFKNNMKLEIGGSVSIANTNSFSNFEIEELENPEISNYNYSENNYASYTQLSGAFYKIDYYAGLRMENTYLKGGFEDNNTLLIDKNQTRFYPKIGLVFPLDSTKTISINYSKTITRPNYSQANSLTTFINPFFEFSNNINLVSTTRQNISINFQRKKSAIKLSYYNRKNPIYYSISYNDQLNRATMSPTNFKKESGYLIEFNTPFKYKFWNSNNFVTSGIIKIEDPNALLKKSSPYLYYYSNNDFSISKNTSLNLNFWGVTKRNEGVFERKSLFIVGFSASKTIYEKLNITLHFNDIFRGMNFDEKYNINQINSQTIYYVDAREVSLSMKYSFGNITQTSYKNKNVDENLNRIK